MVWENSAKRLQVGQLKRTLACAGEKWLADTVNLIDGEGRLLEEIDILGALLESPYNGILYIQPEECDLTHLNFAHQLGADAGGADGHRPRRHRGLVADS